MRSIGRRLTEASQHRVVVARVEEQQPGVILALPGVIQRGLGDLLCAALVAPRCALLPVEHHAAAVGHHRDQAR